MNDAATENKNSNDDDDELFIEVLPPDNNVAPRDRYVQAYIALDVPPQECGSLVKRLGKLQTPQEPATTDLSHLRRVRRRLKESAPTTTEGTSTKTKPPLKEEDATAGAEEPHQNDKSISKTKNQPRQTVQLDVVLGAVGDLDRTCATHSSVEDHFRHSYSLVGGTIVKVMVPARRAESQAELQEFDQYWPTVFYANRTVEHLQQTRRLTAAEVRQMQVGLQAASQHGGAVMMDPISGKVLSGAHEEAQQQQTQNNPLATPILFAIQGISRQERQVACNSGMNNPAFQEGQYLCTGLDCYTIHEPTVFEAMSLVHARIRWVVFGVPRDKGGLTHSFVHNLPDTNHKFRAFLCRPDSELAQHCQKSN